MTVSKKVTIFITPEAQRAAVAVRDLLKFIGENPDRDGLKDTPARVVRAWQEMASGYNEDPGDILSRTFEESYDEMVILRSISFHSTCEHHLLPFTGTASIGYLPGKVVGISKLVRLVNCFAHRLQIQEKMTREIALAIEKHLEAKGVGVVVKARHSCMGCRGVRQSDAEMVTSAILGRLRESQEARAEFLKLIG